MFKYLLIAALVACVAAGGGDESHAETVKYINDVRPDGSFDSAIETTNGIYQSASGDVHGNIHGSFSFKSHEGIPISISYVADENGYQPQGDAVPQIPKEILRAIQYIQSHPSNEKY